ncbi:DNA-directed RNA polymerase subunit beta [Texcoconibacillus texcoconensis]|uniref:DNA-directed RNA polymerase subunit beta n=1 Tax=Texcoconibacillus texcoconensis TaxID=1095777 RepID=A0A840QTL8_9BACI|nr:DNA-directed RNA polymerase subunit beta [Texcoconibacillus texcoconensis]MBB5174617.1 hypothetical protein [Texcoconibacillus texcoconensis]
MSKDEQNEPRSRRERKKVEREQGKDRKRQSTSTNTEENAKIEDKKKPRIRMVPIWLRIVIIVGLAFVGLIFGAMFGYGILGGENPIEALNPDTWRHIYDIIYDGID